MHPRHTTSEQNLREDIEKAIRDGTIILAEGHDPFGAVDDDSYFPKKGSNREFPVLVETACGRITEIAAMIEECLRKLIGKELSWLELGPGAGFLLADLRNRHRVKRVDSASMTALAPHFIPHTFYGIRRGPPRDGPMVPFPQGFNPPHFEHTKEQYVHTQYIGQLSAATPLSSERIYHVIHDCVGPLNYIVAEERTQVIELLLRALNPKGALAVNGRHNRDIGERILTVDGSMHVVADNDWMIACGPECPLSKELLKGVRDAGELIMRLKNVYREIMGYDYYHRA